MKLNLLLEKAGFTREDFARDKKAYDDQQRKLENRIKSAGLARSFSSKGMNDLEILIYLIDQTQEVFREIGCEDFLMAKVLGDTCRGTSIETRIAKINEYVRWNDLEKVA